MEFFFGKFDNTDELIEYLASEEPPSLPLIGMQTPARQLPEAALSAVARFPSGAIRTIGIMIFNDNGLLELIPFGTWSLLDPEADISSSEDIPQEMQAHLYLIAMEVQ